MDSAKTEDRPLLEVLRLGSQSHQETHALQQELIEKRAAGSIRDPLILVEHEPVITVGRGADLQAFCSSDLPVVEVERGGEATYHGPGQLVGYPILDLNRLDLRLHGYLRWLEARVLETLDHFGLRGQRDEEATGVWIDGDQGLRKIAAMGVRVSRWVSMHCQKPLWA